MVGYGTNACSGGLAYAVGVNIANFRADHAGHALKQPENSIAIKEEQRRQPLSET